MNSSSVSSVVKNLLTTEDTGGTAVKCVYSAAFAVVDVATMDCSAAVAFAVQAS
jgi:hypothetical protein